MEKPVTESQILPLIVSAMHVGITEESKIGKPIKFIKEKRLLVVRLPSAKAIRDYKALFLKEKGLLRERKQKKMVDNGSNA